MGSWSVSDLVVGSDQVTASTAACMSNNDLAAAQRADTILLIS